MIYKYVRDYHQCSSKKSPQNQGFLMIPDRAKVNQFGICSNFPSKTEANFLDNNSQACSTHNPSNNRQKK